MSKKDSDAQAVAGVHTWLVLIKAYHSLLAYASKDFAANGLGDSDFRVLEVLLHKGALPVNTIGHLVMLTPGSISIAVDRLHAKGLVSRIESEADRRVRLVDLTIQGRKLITRAFEIHSERMEHVMSVLSMAERCQLTKALKKIGKHALRELADSEDR